MTGSVTSSSISTASCSTIARSCGTSGTAVVATASTRWSTTTRWPQETARAASSWNPSPTAISATGLSGNEMAHSVMKRARRIGWRRRVSSKRRLEAILEGEPPYDIFVRWKSIHEQPIGWEPDINDGDTAQHPSLHGRRHPWRQEGAPAFFEPSPRFRGRRTEGRRY